MQLNTDYNNADKYMSDYRLNLLSAFIEMKLGLKQKQTKAASLINTTLYNITKETNLKQ